MSRKLLPNSLELRGWYWADADLLCWPPLSRSWASVLSASHSHLA
jgi:hypothetical protein